jgi:hypothetical protein
MHEREPLKRPNATGDNAGNSLKRNITAGCLGRVSISVAPTSTCLTKPSYRPNAFGSLISACVGNAKSDNERGLPAKGILAASGDVNH